MVVPYILCFTLNDQIIQTPNLARIGEYFCYLISRFYCSFIVSYRLENEYYLNGMFFIVNIFLYAMYNKSLLTYQFNTAI